MFNDEVELFLALRSSNWWAEASASDNRRRFQGILRLINFKKQDQAPISFFRDTSLPTL